MRKKINPIFNCLFVSPAAAWLRSGARPDERRIEAGDWGHQDHVEGEEHEVAAIVTS